MTKKDEEKLQSKIKELEEQLEYKHQLIFTLDESIPVEQQARKKYVSELAFFYHSSFKKKLQHLIGLQLEELAQIGRTERGSDIIRSNINCFRLIDDWMQDKANEHVGNLNGIRDSFKGDENIINELKEKYT